MHQFMTILAFAKIVHVSITGRKLGLCLLWKKLRARYKSLNTLVLPSYIYICVSTKLSDNYLCHCTLLFIYYWQKASLHYTRRYKKRKKCKETLLQIFTEEVVIRHSVWAKKEKKCCNGSYRLLLSEVENKAFLCGIPVKLFSSTCFLRSKVSLSISLFKWKRPFSNPPNTIELLRPLHY